MTKVALVFKKSRFDLYSHSNEGETRAFAEGNRELIENDAKHQRTLDAVIQFFDQSGISHELFYRGELREHGLPNGTTLVLAVGGDGTFIDASHYVTDVPIAGINSDPNHSVGFYATVTLEQLPQLIEGNLPKINLQRIVTEINGARVGASAINDIRFGDALLGGTARYEYRGTSHKDDGLLVSTAQGSTAYMWNAGGSIVPLDSKYMQVHVMAKRGSGYDHVEEVRFRNLMRHGALVIDPRHQCNDVPIGAEVVLRLGDPLMVYGDLMKQRTIFLEKQGIY